MIGVGFSPTTKHRTKNNVYSKVMLVQEDTFEEAMYSDCFGCDLFKEGHEDTCSKCHDGDKQHWKFKMY